MLVKSYCLFPLYKSHQWAHFSFSLFFSPLLGYHLTSEDFLMHFIYLLSLLFIYLFFSILVAIASFSFSAWMYD